MVHIIYTKMNNEVIEVTEIIRRDFEQSGVRSGIIQVTVPHTTVGLAIKENADTKVKPNANIMHEVTEKVNQDLHHTGVTQDVTATFVPNSSKAMASLIGNCAAIKIDNGVMKIGSGQGMYLYEFDGPKARNINVKIIQG